MSVLDRIACAQDRRDEAPNSMHWRIKHIFNFPPDKPWEHGYVNFGFHGRSGAQHFLHYNEHWLGRLTAEDEWPWTAGAVDKGLSRVHIPFGIQHPHYITELPDGSLLVSSNGTNQIFRLRPAERAVELFADTGRLGLRDIGNCVYDGRGSVWAHEIEGCRVWQLDLAGRPLRVLGSGTPGFQREAVPFEAARFNWIYDLRLGPDGDLYVLDSKNFCVRRIEVDRGVVSLVAGTGEPGPAAENVPALTATFGSDPSARFDGPFALSLDEAGNVFVGDTYNHVVRMVERATGVISTIAGKVAAEPGVRNNPAETDPLKLNLPLICSLDYDDGCLFVPDWSDDLIVLEKQGGGKDEPCANANEDLGFDFAVRKNGAVAIFHRQRLAAILRGRAAEQFVAQAEALPDAALQQIMTRVTGNYKRGNERTAADHPRNRLRQDSTWTTHHP